MEALFRMVMLAKFGYNVPSTFRGDVENVKKLTTVDDDERTNDDKHGSSLTTPIRLLEENNWKKTINGHGQHIIAHAYMYDIRVVRGLIDIVVVLLISTSWTPMLERAGSIPSCDSMRLGCQVPADWRWFINFPTIKLGKSRYRLYWVESTINQELKKIHVGHNYKQSVQIT